MDTIRRSQSTAVICQVNNNNYQLLDESGHNIGDFSGVTQRKGKTFSFN